MSPPAPGLDVAVLALGPVRGLAFRGEIDIATAPQMSDALDEAIRGSAGPFAIDLLEVTFVDSTGLQALLRARALLGREDRPLLLLCQPGPVRRILEVAGIDGLFAIYGSRDELARELGPQTSQAAG